MAQILIIDDERVICEEFRELIQEEGHHVDFALSGMEAIDRVKESDYDIIFLDVLLPRMEGRQVFEEIRKIKQIPVVFISGYLPPNKEREVLALGAAACLRKPLELDRVFHLIQQVQEEKS